jgi:hypothetical protein
LSGVQVDNEVPFGQNGAISDVRKSCVIFCRRGKASLKNGTNG